MFDMSHIYTAQYMTQGDILKHTECSLLQNWSWGRYGSIQSLVANKNLTRAKHYRLTESTVNNNAWIRDQTFKLETDRFTCSHLIPNKLQLCFFSSNIY